MTISRANMKSQMKGNKMKKKKPVIKANVGKFLENVSPAYSLMKGKGLPNDLITGGGILGVLGKAMKKDKDVAGAPEAPTMKAPASMAMQGATPMKHGGAMKRKRPIDGVATKGKTRGRMC